MASILIVEDSMIVSTHIKSLLAEEGYAITGVVSTGEEAIRISQVESPDLILLDIMLAGEISGIETAEKLRDICKSPIIFLTAMTDKATLDRAKRTGPYSFVIKPFDERDLLTRIELALFKSNLEKQDHRKRLATLIEGQEMERARVSRDLHDGLGQLLNAMKFNIDSVDLLTKDPVNEKLSRLINDAVIEIRRIAENLLPVRLNNADLVTCLSSLCLSMETPNLSVTFQTDAADLRVTDHQKLMIYRIIQEALQNAIRHAGCSRIFVQLYKDGAMLHLSVEDNGSGFDVARSMDGHGLHNIRYRTEILNGQFTVESSQGKGTLLVFIIPLQHEHEHHTRIVSG